MPFLMVSAWVFHRLSVLCFKYRLWLKCRCLLKDGGPFYVMKDFFGALTPGLAKTNMTDGYSSMVLTVVTMFIGLFVIIILAHKGVNGAVLLVCLQPA